MRDFDTDSTWPDLDYVYHCGCLIEANQLFKDGTFLHQHLIPCRDELELSSDIRAKEISRFMRALLEPFYTSIKQLLQQWLLMTSDGN